MVMCLRGSPSGFTLPARHLRSCQLLLASRSRMAAFAFVVLLTVVLLATPLAAAEKLQITSNPPGAAVSLDTADFRVELSLGEVVRRTKPRSYFWKGLNKSGTGFFVTETGVIATNAHVARDEGSLLAALPDGLQLEAKIVYVDAELASRRLKLQATNFLICRLLMRLCAAGRKRFRHRQSGRRHAVQRQERDCERRRQVPERWTWDVDPYRHADQSRKQRRAAAHSQRIAGCAEIVRTP